MSKSNEPAHKTDSVLDLRKHRRINMLAKARYLASDGREYDAVVQDASISGLFLHSVHKPKSGDRIIVYVDGFGRVECIVRRVIDEGFAVEFGAGERKRDRLVEKLTLFANQELLEGKNIASFPSISSKQEAVTLCLENGDVIPCKVKDFSLVSASVHPARMIAIGERVSLGKMKGRVAAHAGDDLIVKFHVGKPLDDN